MSKTNDTSEFRTEDVETLDLGAANTFTVRELRNDELKYVSGGHCPFNFSKVEMEYKAPALAPNGERS